MESTMPVNEYLHEEITRVDHTLIPPGVTGDVRTIRLVQESLSREIDNMGRGSSGSQGLSKVITSAEKLRKTPSHILYLLKDAQGKGGSGEVIGMLKVGRKHLYLYDDAGKPHEVEPLCVLDFYVVGDRQRAGHGKVLFDYMLQDQDIPSPVVIAVDGPSVKIANFLTKNYGVGTLKKQCNNFAVSPGFFETTVEQINGSGNAMPAMPPAAVGRYTAHKPNSTIASVIHGGGDDNDEGAGPSNEEAEPATTEYNAEPRAEPEPVVATPLAAETTTTPQQSPTAAADGEPESPPTIKRPQWLGLGETSAGGSPGAAHSPAPAAGSASLERRDSQLTTQGYFDVKFYHNKLW